MGSNPQGGAVVRDPVHGDIELTREELRVIDTAAFQRLRGVKQLGTAYLVYPGAMHTRFEHALGTVHVMDRLLDAANRNAARDPAGCHRVSDEERRVLRIAALLHDVTHIPFGHNLEDQTGLLERHDEPQRFEAALGDGEIGDVLRELGVQREIMGILAGRGMEVPPFWRQVLSDTIDADLLDYLRRDAYHTGLELRYDTRVRDYFPIDRRSQRLFVDCEKHGMLREDIASELLRLLEIRYHFSERVYYHHAKIAAGALIARMVEMAMRGGLLSPADLHGATDESLLFRIESAAERHADSARLLRFARAFRSRRLPKRVLVLPAYLNAGVQDELLATYFRKGAPEPRYEWEASVEAEARRVLGRDVDVVMYCPARRMQLKEARTLVRFPNTQGALEPLEHYVDQVPRLRDLRDSYPRLWKLYVFGSERDPVARRRLQDICLARLPSGVVNALRL